MIFETTKVYGKIVVIAAFLCLLAANPAYAGLSATQTDLGNQLKFTVSISDSSLLEAFGFDILYDSNALNYLKYENGDLIPDESFFFNVNMISSGQIRIGGAGAIQGGQSGSIAVLTFDKIVYLENYSVGFVNLLDGVEDLAVTGDINGDASINLSDVILVLKKLAGISDENAIFIDTDANNDKKIGMENVVYILQVIAELRKSS